MRSSSSSGAPLAVAGGGAALPDLGLHHHSREVPTIVSWMLLQAWSLVACAAEWPHINKYFLVNIANIFMKGTLLRRELLAGPPRCNICTQMRAGRGGSVGAAWSDTLLELTSKTLL